jgi:hypothetical protein
MDLFANMMHSVFCNAEAEPVGHMNAYSFRMNKRIVRELQSHQNNKHVVDQRDNLSTRRLRLCV